MADRKRKSFPRLPPLIPANLVLDDAVAGTPAEPALFENSGCLDVSLFGNRGLKCLPAMLAGFFRAFMIGRHARGWGLG